MKNINVFGRKYEVRAQVGCEGCLFAPAGMRPECDATPCVGSRTANEGRGPFIVVKGVPTDTPTPTPVAGRKDDTGKLDMSLLDDMPRAVKAVVEVMQWAITEKKPTPYVRGSWLGVHADRYRAAIARHGRDAAERASPGPDLPTAEVRFQRDKETNLLHLAHIACSAMMALENTLREQERG